MKIKFEDKLDKKINDKIRKALKDGLLLATNEAKNRAIKDCPINTGALRNSIYNKVEKDKLVGTIGTNMNYATHVEYGTKFFKGKSFLRRAIYHNPIDLVDLFKYPLSRLLKGK